MLTPEEVELAMASLDSAAGETAARIARRLRPQTHETNSAEK
jgi:hypothetical protein